MPTSRERITTVFGNEAKSPHVHHRSKILSAPAAKTEGQAAGCPFRGKNAALDQLVTPGATDKIGAPRGQPHPVIGIGPDANPLGPCRSF